MIAKLGVDLRRRGLLLGWPDESHPRGPLAGSGLCRGYLEPGKAVVLDYAGGSLEAQELPLGVQMQYVQASVYGQGRYLLLDGSDGRPSGLQATQRD